MEGTDSQRSDASMWQTQGPKQGCLFAGNFLDYPKITRRSRASAESIGGVCEVASKGSAFLLEGTAGAQGGYKLYG